MMGYKLAVTHSAIMRTELELPGTTHTHPIITIALLALECGWELSLCKLTITQRNVYKPMVLRG